MNTKLEINKLNELRKLGWDTIYTDEYRFGHYPVLLGQCIYLCRGKTILYVIRNNQKKYPTGYIGWQGWKYEVPAIDFRTMRKVGSCSLSEDAVLNVIDKKDTHLYCKAALNPITEMSQKPRRTLGWVLKKEKFMNKE